MNTENLSDINVKILVAEDDTGLQHLIIKNLERNGFTADGASSGSETIQKIKTGKYDLMLLDYRLSDMSGHEIVSYLKNDNTLIPFVIMTGFGDTKLAVDMMKLGARDFLTKTTDLIELLPQIVNHVVKEILTERNLSEAKNQLYQAQKLKSVGLLAGGIAHDFNNILTIIAGCLHNALAISGDNEQLKLELNEAYKICMNASNLTRQLLVFSKSQKVEKTKISLNSVIDTMINLLNKLMDKNINFDKNLKSGLWLVEADAANMEQIIMNLTINSRDAMQSGGTLTITTENIDIQDKVAATFPNIKSGKYICLTVTDTGTGMSKETLEHIFDPFYTTKEDGKGTGLGLSVVYGIVEKHNGHITVSTEIGKGTTFKLFFPAL